VNTHHHPTLVCPLTRLPFFSQFVSGLAKVGGNPASLALLGSLHETVLLKHGGYRDWELAMAVEGLQVQSTQHIDHTGHTHRTGHKDKTQTTSFLTPLASTDMLRTRPTSPLP
jgi:hypothetical protein